MHDKEIEPFFIIKNCTKTFLQLLSLLWLIFNPYKPKEHVLQKHQKTLQLCLELYEKSSCCRRGVWVVGVWVVCVGEQTQNLMNVQKCDLFKRLRRQPSSPTNVLSLNGYLNSLNRKCKRLVLLDIHGNFSALKQLVNVLCTAHNFQSTSREQHVKKFSV